MAAPPTLCRADWSRVRKPKMRAAHAYFILAFCSAFADGCRASRRSSYR